MPPQLALIRPNANLRDSYCALIAEFVANGDALVPFTLSFDHTDFDKFLTKLDDCYRGVGIPNGFVPHSTFWLVRGGNEVVGVSNTTPRLDACAAARRGPHRLWHPARLSPPGPGYCHPAQWRYLGI